MLAATTAALTAAPGIAHAGLGDGPPTKGKQHKQPTKTKTQGNSAGGKVSALAGVQFDLTKNGTGPDAGPVSPVSNWTPPACWYAPKYDPESAARDFLGYDRSPNHTGMEEAQWVRNRYIKGHPYTNFNLAKQGKGYWWVAELNDNRLTDPGVDDCTNPPFWVDKGAPPPPVKNALTPEILAQLAYAEIRIPQGQARTSDITSTVNLPTWIWLDKTTFHPVSVRAYISVLGIEATTTATPIGLHIDPGTQDAIVDPDSGDCPINAKGEIGTPYAKGNTGVPPCGVTYLRSTQNTGPYRLKATVTWKISWTGTGQPTPVALPDGTFGTPQDVHVREVQTINR